MEKPPSQYGLRITSLHLDYSVQNFPKSTKVKMGVAKVSKNYRGKNWGYMNHPIAAPPPTPGVRGRVVGKRESSPGSCVLAVLAARQLAGGKVEGEGEGIDGEGC
jgi:hypothetical protein